MTCGIYSLIKFNPNDPEHVRRRDLIQQLQCGWVAIGPQFHCFLSKVRPLWRFGIIIDGVYIQSVTIGNIGRRNSHFQCKTSLGSFVAKGSFGLPNRYFLVQGRLPGPSLARRSRSVKSGTRLHMHIQTEHLQNSLRGFAQFMRIYLSSVGGKPDAHLRLEATIGN